jgi:hypothetical protein
MRILPSYASDASAPATKAFTFMTKEECTIPKLEVYISAEQDSIPEAQDSHSQEHGSVPKSEVYRTKEQDFVTKEGQTVRQEKRRKRKEGKKGTGTCFFSDPLITSLQIVQLRD